MPPRVVSLLPSATEALCAVGGASLLVGRSHECDFPPGIAHLPVLTGAKVTATQPAEIDRQVREALAGGSANQSLYSLFAERLLALRPDVILTQDLCEVCSIDLETVRGIARELERLGHRAQVVSLNPTTVEGVLDDLLTVGRAVGLEGRARDEVVRLRERLFAAGEHVNPFDDGPVVAFLEWTDPLFCAGHWTVQMIERAGGRHPFNPTVARPASGAAAGPQQGERVAGRSQRITPEELVAARPERVVVCPCGMGMEASRACARALAEQLWWRDLPAASAPPSRVAIVDGNQMFNRPGPRLVDAFEWLVGWMTDQERLMPRGFPWEAFSARP
jgi:ABC-type Fe3+-hydroxamate transport system substrate-binding protein